jgi:hypothetical protein
MGTHNRLKKGRGAWVASCDRLNNADIEERKKVEYVMPLKEPG